MIAPPPGTSERRAPRHLFSLMLYADGRHLRFDAADAAIRCRG